MSIDFQPILIKFFFSDNLILLDQLFIYCIDIRSIGVISLLLFFLFLENFRNLFVLALVCLLFRKNIIICHLRQYEVTAFLDRKSTRLNSSHVAISYAVFCLK